MPTDPRAEDLRKIIGDNIRARRKVLDLTQHDLSEAVGTTRQRIGRIEAGSTDLDFSEVPALATKLGLPDPLVLLQENLFAAPRLKNPKFDYLG